MLRPKPNIFLAGTAMLLAGLSKIVASIKIAVGRSESREDRVTLNNVADGLNGQMIEHGLIEPNGRKKRTAPR